MHTDMVVARLDGTLLPVDRPLLRVDDAGVVRGDGVFDATLAVDGSVRDLDEHLDRLATSARMLECPIPGPAAWRVGIDACVRAWDGRTREMAVRLNVSRGVAGEGANCWVTGAAVSAVSVRQRTVGVRVLTLAGGFAGPAAAAAPWLLAGAKTLSYAANMAALRYAAAHDAEDVIFLDPAGLVLEAPTASVVVARDRTLTSPPQVGILAGITVQRLFAAAGAAGWDTAFAPLAAGELTAADAVWLTSAVRLIAPVTAVDGATRGDAGLTAEVSALLQVPTG